MQADIWFHAGRALALFNALNQNVNWKLGVYKGVMPTESEIAGGFNATAAARTSDLLLEGTYSGASNFGRTTDNYLRLFMLNIPALTTRAAGTASWFSLYIPTGSGTADQQLFGLVGDVSLADGTAPLRLSDTTIATANTYELLSFAFTLGA